MGDYRPIELLSVYLNSGLRNALLGQIYAVYLLLMEEELSRSPETFLKVHPVRFLLGGKNNPQTFQVTHVAVTNDLRLLEEGL